MKSYKVIELDDRDIRRRLYVYAALCLLLNGCAAYDNQYQCQRHNQKQQPPVVKQTELPCDIPITVEPFCFRGNEGTSFSIFGELLGDQTREVVSLTCRRDGTCLGERLKLSDNNIDRLDLVSMIGARVINQTGPIYTIKHGLSTYNIDTSSGMFTRREELLGQSRFSKGFVGPCRL